MQINNTIHEVDELKRILTKILGVHKDEILMSSRLDEDLGADSLDAVEIIMDCEKEFNISISDEEGSEVKRVMDLAVLISNKKDI